VVGTHHHDNASGIGGLDLAQNFDAVYAGRHDIEQYEIRLLVFKYLQRFFAGCGRQYFESCGSQSAADGTQRQVFVIDDQDGVGHNY